LFFIAISCEYEPGGKKVQLIRGLRYDFRFTPPLTVVYFRVMEWEHKGITFSITTLPLGALVMASARAPREGPYVRVRPFSALGTSEEEALERLKNQIRQTYRRVPEIVA